MFLVEETKRTLIEKKNVSLMIDGLICRVIARINFFVQDDNFFFTQFQLSNFSDCPIIRKIFFFISVTSLIIVIEIHLTSWKKPRYFKIQILAS